MSVVPDDVRVQLDTTGPAKLASPHWPFTPSAPSTTSVKRTGTCRGVTGKLPFLPVAVKLSTPGVTALRLMTSLVRPWSPSRLRYCHPFVAVFQPTPVPAS